MFEHRSEPLISRAAFLRRLAAHGGYAFLLLTLSLGIGVLGYHSFANLSWLDALLNASMILGGMGPVDPLRASVAKLFASFYALFSGFVLIIVFGILNAPIYHRILHHFHLDDEDT